MPRPHIPLRTLKSLLFLADLVGILFFANLAYFLRFGYLDSDLLFNSDLLIFIAAVMLPFYVLNLFDPQAQIWGLRAPYRVWVSALFSAVVLALYLFISRTEAILIFGRGIMATTLACFAVYSSLTRFFVARWLKKREVFIRWLILGSNGYVNQFWQDYLNHKIEGQVAFLIPEFEVDSERDPLIPIIGTWKDLDKHLFQGWSGVVVATERKLDDDILERLLKAKIKGMRVYDLTDFYEDIWFKVPVFYLDRSWLALTQGFGLLHNRVSLRIKRVFDFAGAVLLLPLFLPLIALAGLLVAIESGFPVFYSQKRTGKDGRTFTLTKLRTMCKEAEADGAVWSTNGDSRITWVGHWLRLFRIDELPQIFNVLKGDMSFIGPRPERPEFNLKLEKDIPHYNLRHTVRPGITGWAQVLYRYGSSVADSREKLQYDLYYIKNHSFFLDLAVFFKTIRVVLLGVGQ